MLLVFPFLYNHIGYGKIIEHRIFSWGFAILYLCMFFLMLGTLFWVSYVTKEGMKDVDSGRSRRGLHRLLYYAICVAPGLLALLIFVAGSFFANPQLPDILYYNVKYRLWVYALAVVCFAYWRLKSAKRQLTDLQASAAEQPPALVEAEVLPAAEAASRMYIVAADKNEVREIIQDALEPIMQDMIARSSSPGTEIISGQDDGLHALYQRLIVLREDSLYNASGIVRFFYIVLIRVRSKGGDVYLMDGTCIRCSNIQETLRELGLLECMVRIHKSCMVNMMHVHMNHYKEGGHLLLQRDTMARMTENGLRKMDVMNLLQFGPNIGTANVEQFIANRADRWYEVWDIFVPIKKKHSPDQ
ncbi:hypothetical protein M472_02820 [Sphingobacterium paucimobilis HER1398]|uniref:Uncharacterized protein n=2 Tax=Sphingobacterium TaxID=28453 RepID=U2H7L5_9SPHI|nr:hypothetical protein M472_02820 [Sphingobacterium paucimobilis HER1398]